ncbi:LADA_0H17832g1_1 [Lachancea dasiensis]|uniref:LADA_0H17832g1_1 n=1 Tax=Lachancea dasiensis TaxID=1072105 RepID=A0A1G4K5T3_9SACH|nr:LADA_0H17832g1_1 [Lachancea dasiensis]
MISKKTTTKYKRSTVACTRCRRRKIKCNGKKPCPNCEVSDSKCQFENDDQVENKDAVKFVRYSPDFLSTVDAVRSTARSITTVDPMLDPNITEALNELAKLVQQSRTTKALGLDLRKAQNHVGARSLENHIDCELRGTARNEHNSSFPGKIYFGLYSPAFATTPGEVAPLYKALLINGENEQTRHTTQLFLKFADIATSYWLKVSQFYRFPVENTIGYIFPDQDNTSTIRKYELFLDIIPSQLRPTHTAETIATTCVLPSLVDIMAAQYEKGKGIIVSKSSATEIASFMKSLNTIALLCIDQFQKHAFLEHLSFEFINATIKYLECRALYDQILYLGKLISHLVRSAMDLGLNRWEYYADLDEASADTKRITWWKCFWWDQFNALLHGKLPLIDINTSICLFPKCLMAMGLEESTSVRGMVEKAATEKCSSDSLRLWAWVTMGKVINELYRSTLFSRKYTNYLPVGSTEQAERMKELVIDYHSLTELLDLFNSKIEKLRSRLDMSTLISIGYFNIGCLLSFEKLLARFAKVCPLPQDLHTCIRDCSKRYTACSRNSLARSEMAFSASLLSSYFPCFITAYFAIVNHFVLSSETGYRANDLMLICRFSRTLFLFGHDADDLSKIEKEDHMDLGLRESLSLLALTMAKLCLQVHVNRVGRDTTFSSLDLALCGFCSELLELSSNIWQAYNYPTRKTHYNIAIHQYFENHKIVDRKTDSVGTQSPKAAEENVGLPIFNNEYLDFGAVDFLALFGQNMDDIPYPSLGSL